MKRWTQILTMLLLFSLIGGCGNQAVETNEDLSIAVKTEKIGQIDMKTNYNTSGKIEAAAEATIAPRVAGRVAEVDVKLGDKVEKGQPLFRIEDKEAKNQVTQSQASLGIAQAGYDMAIQALKDAQTNYERYQSLFDSGVISLGDLETANTRLANAKIGLEQAEKQMEQGQAALNMSRENLADYTVVSPIDGYVGEINISFGELISSQTNAAVIVDISAVKVAASVPEAVVNAIKPGSKVPVTIDSLNISLEGTVTAIAPKADNSTMGYPAEIILDNPRGEIKPGMAVKIELFTGALKNIIAVPVDTVIEQDGQQIVYIVENNQAREIIVEVGASNGTQIQITKGLMNGQLIVTEGNRLLSDGQKVRIVTGQESGE